MELEPGEAGGLGPADVVDGFLAVGSLFIFGKLVPVSADLSHLLLRQQGAENFIL